MNFDWIKTPKNQHEEKEQFDKLYHMLVRMSGSSIASVPSSSPPMDEFTRLKLDLLANLRMSGGVSIPPLETCRGCDRSFYSQEELNKHYHHAPACQEWVRRGLVRTPSTEIPFFSFLEEGLSLLLGSGGRTCRFCEKPMANRKALERHFQATVLCNRLAHDTFRSWWSSLPPLPPAQPTLSLPAPRDSSRSV